MSLFSGLRPATQPKDQNTRRSVLLGQSVVDKLTGFKGLVTGRCEYLTGCHQVLVQPRVNAENEFVEPRWFDEDRAELLDGRIVSLQTVNPGFDKEPPKR
jgi:hypothetical protein